MSDGVYRKTAADLRSPSESNGNQPAEPNRITAVIQSGTIQVGYTPVAATLAATMAPPTAGASNGATPVRPDQETTPGFHLAAPDLPTATEAPSVPTTTPGTAQTIPTQTIPAEEARDDRAPAQSGVATATSVAERPAPPPRGVHPVIPIGFMVLISLFGQALYWGEPMIYTLRIVQMPIPVLILALAMAPFAFWLGRANDQWGPTPWLIAIAIFAHSLITPFINLWLGGPGLGDVHLYHEYGVKLLNTGMIPTNPAPEYPPLAVWTFGLIAYLTTEIGLFPAFSTALVMSAPALIVSLMLGRSRHAWMLAYIALMPWSAMWLVIRFDAIPTALLVIALFLVRPDKPAATGKVILSALVFGLAAAAKWYPGLAAIVLFFGYLAVRQWKHAIIMCVGSIIGFAIPHFPWVLTLLGRQALIDAYLFHAGRGVTGESLIWQVLYPLGLTGMPTYAWADSPNLAAGPWPTAFAVTAIAVPIVVAILKPHRAWVTAVIAPAMWLMANRIFSVQFVLTITVLWVVALVLYPRLSYFWRIIMLFSLAVLNAANWMIWPIMDRGWPTYSAIVFVFLVPITIGLWVLCGYKEKAIHLDGNHAFTRLTTRKEEEEPEAMPGEHDSTTHNPTNSASLRA